MWRLGVLETTKKSFASGKHSWPNLCSSLMWCLRNISILPSSFENLSFVFLGLDHWVEMRVQQFWLIRNDWWMTTENRPVVPSQIISRERYLLSIVKHLVQSFSCPAICQYSGCERGTNWWWPRRPRRPRRRSPRRLSAVQMKHFVSVAH